MRDLQIAALGGGCSPIDADACVRLIASVELQADGKGALHGCIASGCIRVHTEGCNHLHLPAQKGRRCQLQILHCGSTVRWLACDVQPIWQGAMWSRPCSMQQHSLAESHLSKSRAGASASIKELHAGTWQQTLKPQGSCRLVFVCKAMAPGQLLHASSRFRRAKHERGAGTGVQDCHLEGAAGAVAGQLQAAVAVELLLAQARHLLYWVHEQRG